MSTFYTMGRKVDSHFSHVMVLKNSVLTNFGHQSASGEKISDPMKLWVGSAMKMGGGGMVFTF